MTGPAAAASPAQGRNPSPLQRGLGAICTALAVSGGLVILGAAAAVTYSVVSSALGGGAVRGEFEMIELACAVSVSLFLPLCQLRRGHVMVDVFTAALPRKANRGLDTLWLMLLAAVWAFLCVRLFHGMVDLRGYGDRTMLLRVPLWWAYLPAIAGTGLSALVAGLSALTPILPGALRLEPAR